MRTIAKALGRAFLIGAFIGTLIGGPGAILVARYGWNTVNNNKAPWWLRTHFNRLPKNKF